MQCYSTIVHNNRSSRPHCIVSVTYVVSEHQAKSFHLQLDQTSSSSKHHQPTSHNSTSASSAAAERTRQTKASRSNRSKKPPRPSPYHHQSTKLTHSNNTTEYHNNNNNNNSACGVIRAYGGQPYYTTGLLSTASYSQGVDINGAASVDRTDAVYERYSHCAETLPRYGYEYSYPDDTGSAMQYSQLRGMTPNHFAYFGYFGSSVIRPASSPSPVIIQAAPDQSSESSPAGFRIHAAPLNLYSNYSQNYSGYSSSAAYAGGLAAHSDSGINSSSSPSSPPSYVTESGTPCSSRGYPVQGLDAGSQSTADAVASIESAASSSTDSMQKSAGLLLSSCARQGQQQVDIISTQIADDHSSLRSPLFVSACLASAGGSNDTWQDKYSDSPTTTTTDLLPTGSGSVIVRRRLTADTDALKHQNGGASNSAVTVTPQHTAPDFDWTDGGYETGTALSASVLKSSSSGDLCWRDDSFYLLTKGGHVTHPSMRVASSSSTSSAGKSASFSCDVTARFSEAISDETDKTTDSGNFLMATGNPVPSGYTSVIVDMPTTVNYAG